MKKIFDVIWKSLIVGAGYTIMMMVGGMIIRALGLILPEVNDIQMSVMWLFVGGVIAGLFLGPIASSLAASWLRHLIIWGSVLFFNLASVAVEGSFFAPDLVGNSLAGMLIQQMLSALAMGWIITTLFASKGTSVSSDSSHRSFFSWVWRFLAGALSYLVFYFIFGAINYALITKPYYESNVGGLTVPTPSNVLAAELIRGPLIVLSVLPFLLTWRMGKMRLIIFTGLILFSIGGLLPLTMQASALPFFLLAASAIEIFFQNFSTGAVAALLLGQSK